MSQPKLTGRELVALVDSMPTATKSQLVQAAGYVTPDGRRQFTEFYQALLQARGQALPGGGDGRGQRPLSFRTTVLSHGGLLVGKRYVEDALDLRPGDVVSIASGKGRLVLTRAAAS